MRSNAKIMCSLLATTGLVGATPATAKDEPEIIMLEPSGAWNLDMGEHKCRIARLFGEGDSQVIFLIDQWDPSNMGQWTVAGPAFAGFRNGRDTGYTFSHGGDAGEFELLGSFFGDFGTAVQGWSSIVANEADTVGNNEEPDDLASPRSLPSFDAKGATGIEWLTITQRGQTAVRLRLGPLDAPLSAMNNCMENLVEYWGFDLAEQRSVASPPEVTNMQKVAREVAKRYPKSALWRGEQADFHIRVTIDTQGKIEDCVLLSQTTADNFELDGHPCTAFERYAKIEPARDKAGKPIRTYLTNRIVYRVSRGSVSY